MKPNWFLSCVWIALHVVVSFQYSVEAASSDCILLWNQKFIAGMRRETLPPPLIARNLAALHLALQRCQVQKPDCSDALASLAAFKTCARLLPSQTPFFEPLLEKFYPGKISDADRIFADTLCQPLLEQFAKDRSSLHVTYVTRTHPGIWNRTAPFFREPELPHWRQVHPILLQAADQFRPTGPPALDSQTYAEALNEVREWGGKASKKRNPEHELIARFWSDFSYTETPVGHWNSIARVILAARGVNGADAARLFCDLNVAMADASIACWDAKYHFDFWRPITAIQRAAEDKNAETEPDSDWVPYLNTPSHPEYVSGHSTYSGAAYRILATFLGSETVEFEISNDTIPEAKRSFKNLKGCAEECGESRILGGIHYRFSCRDGMALGEKIADWVIRRARSLDR
jgi:hypothetical protein